MSSLGDKNDKKIEFYTYDIYPYLNKLVCLFMGSPTWWRFSFCLSWSSLMFWWCDAINNGMRSMSFYILMTTCLRHPGYIMWIHGGAWANLWCSLATGCGITLSSCLAALNFNLVTSNSLLNFWLTIFHVSPLRASSIEFCRRWYELWACSTGSLFGDRCFKCWIADCKMPHCQVYP